MNDMLNEPYGSPTGSQTQFTGSNQFPDEHGCHINCPIRLDHAVVNESANTFIFLGENNQAFNNHTEDFSPSMSCETCEDYYGGQTELCLPNSDYTNLCGDFPLNNNEENYYSSNFA